MPDSLETTHAKIEDSAENLVDFCRHNEVIFAEPADRMGHQVDANVAISR